MTLSGSERNRLLLLLDAHFSKGELEDLCFGLGIDYENLPGQSKRDNARELIEYADRHGILSELLAACSRLRPSVDWPKVTGGDAFLDDTGVESEAAQSPRLQKKTWLSRIPIPLWAAIITGLCTLVGVIITAYMTYQASQAPIRATAQAELQTTANTASDDFGSADIETTKTAVVATVQPLVRTKKRLADDMVMVYVPAGRFMMGSEPAIDSNARTNEQPQHMVRLDGFWIDQTEVTNRQYFRCVSAGICEPSESANNGSFNADDQPVVDVSWFDAETYCSWAGGQLPTEAQWEYAARGEDSRLYPWGNMFNGELLNYCDRRCLESTDNDYDDGFEFSAPVGSYLEGVSWLGAYDMAGNVWEWTADWYLEDYYGVSPESNPAGPPDGTFKVLRGGGWRAAREGGRSAYRLFSGQTVKDPSVGFRCAVAEP